MSLIMRNEAFLERSLESSDAFGWPITLTNLLGVSQTVNGQYRHINMDVDVETGADVQNEQASATVRLSTVTIGEPAKNWKVSVEDTAGIEYSFYVVEAMPDRTMGMVVLKLGILGE